ncbi:MAG: YceI family protein [Candidatus Kapabacteria bacterium]|jgi:hypothetical protein|nr:YceI family protein [Candidatus Kapabacteria bacterium]
MKPAVKHIILLFSVAYLLMAAFSPSSLQALKLGKYYIESNSRLWIEGTSTLNDYSCTSLRIDGQAVVDSVPGFTKIENWKDTTTKFFVEAYFKVKTKMLDCGHSIMNDDMYDALKAEKYAEISFKLENASILNVDDRNKKTKVKVKGLLSVAGKSKMTSLIVIISESIRDSRYRVQCTADINMKDFDIEPPSALFGLIVADEKLKLNLDLYISNSQYTLK